VELFGAVDDNEMIAAFLWGEINSPRFSARILECLARYGLPRAVVDQPNLTSGVDNSSRRKVLAETRGYGQNRSLLNGFPEGVRWARAMLDRTEICGVRYLNYDYWVELSGGTRLVADGADNIRAGKVVFRVPNDGFWQALGALQRGVKFTPPILVSLDHANLVILEGHTRITAYALAGESGPDRMEVLLGFSDKFAEWDGIDFSG
jgi:hypothetical protein